MPKQTRKREVGSYVRWEPAEVHAKLSYTNKIAWGAVGVITNVDPPAGGNTQVDFDHGLPDRHLSIYWCRATDLRVIKEKDFYIFRAIEALALGDA